LTRYNTSNSIRVLVVDADDKADDAGTYATDASKAAGALENYNTNQLMMMGV